MRFEDLAIECGYDSFHKNCKNVENFIESLPTEMGLTNLENNEVQNVSNCIDLLDTQKEYDV